MEGEEIIVFTGATDTGTSVEGGCEGETTGLAGVVIVSELIEWIDEPATLEAVIENARDEELGRSNTSSIPGANRAEFIGTAPFPLTCKKRLNLETSAPPLSNEGSK